MRDMRVRDDFVVPVTTASRPGRAIAICEPCWRALRKGVRLLWESIRFVLGTFVEVLWKAFLVWDVSLPAAIGSGRPFLKMEV